jgi:hypothetical protein
LPAAARSRLHRDRPITERSIVRVRKPNRVEQQVATALTGKLAIVDPSAKLAYGDKPATREGNQMTRLRAHGNDGNGTSLGASVGLFFLSLICIIAPGAALAVETKNVKIMLDWVIQGTHAPFFIAQDKGYYKAEGVTVDAIDAGRGATNVAVAVAGGAYQFGWVDMPSLVRFNAQNPAAPLFAVYVSFDETPLAVITRKDANIRKPADLDGKKIAGRARQCTTRFRSCSKQQTCRT